MSQLSISEAAKLVSRNRTTLYRLVANGKLTATVDATGSKTIDTSELLRVFGELRTSGDKSNSRATVTMQQRETPDTTARMAVLEAELRHARELLAVRESQIENLRRTVLLLEDRRAPKSRRLWPW